MDLSSGITWAKSYVCFSIKDKQEWEERHKARKVNRDVLHYLSCTCLPHGVPFTKHVKANL